MEFIGDKEVLIMLKMDGLTVKLIYEDGRLKEASTRGNGEIGEIITHNALEFKNIPVVIPYKDKLVVTGEAVIYSHDFEALQNESSSEETFKHARNLVSGTVRSFDSKLCRKRKVQFIPFNVLEGFEQENINSRFVKLQKLKKIGFDECAMVFVATLNNAKYVEECICNLKHIAEKEGIPYDGVVATYDNISFLEGLALSRGDRILVSKRNMIIPHIEENLDYDNGSVELPPKVCTCCGQPTKIRITNQGDTKVLLCENPDCAAKNIQRFVHFVSKTAMNIVGLSESRLEKLIDAGLLSSFNDFFYLKQHAAKISVLDGFGRKSCESLLSAIEASREVTLSQFLIAMDIPMIGKTASKTISDYFKQDIEAFERAMEVGFQFTILDDFGDTLNKNIHEWFMNQKNVVIWYGIKEEVNFADVAQGVVPSSVFSGKTFVVTGTLTNYTRNSIDVRLIGLGAKVSGSVSSKTNYVLFGEKAGSKLEKARKLGVATISEQEFEDMINNPYQEDIKS